MLNFSVIELAILQMIEQVPLHGYAMSKKIELLSGGVLRLPAGSLYPALSKLEGKGMIWSQSEKNGMRKRKTYALTGDGYAALREQKATWNSISQTINALVSMP